ncbi:MAG: hypothetical protein FJ098_11275, partial [Deltaproteobacteria bacterium]|nr:hypothetical protein [Deltaproteobacteria bacterium]
LMARQGAATLPTVEAVRQGAALRVPMRSLQEVLGRFEGFVKLLCDPAAVRLAAAAALRQAAAEGIVYLELRFSPGYIEHFGGVPAADVMAAVADGVAQGQEGLDLEAALLVIATRELGEEACRRSFDLASRFCDRGVVGVDLAGDEDVPVAAFLRPLRAARDAGLRVTLHAGETGRPEAVREAVEIAAADRIGHGIAAIRDPGVVALLRERGIPLEISVTSNWVVGAVPSVEQHPAGALLAQGVRLGFNTDDPTLFDIDLPGELALVARCFDLPLPRLLELQHDALEQSFAPDAVKARVRARIASWCPAAV